MTVSEQQVRALSYISQQLNTADDVRLVAALLVVASGSQPENQAVSIRQYDSLRKHRVLSLVPGDWQLPTDRDASTERRQLMLQQLALLAAARKAISRLDDAGIDTRVLKGVANQELDYASPSQRTFGDVDLLVRQSDFNRAVKVLADSGASLPSPAGERHEQFGIEAALTFDGIEIDLHHRLHRLSAAPQSLFDNPVPLTSVGSFAMQVEQRLVHAASHLLLTAPGFRRLSGLADISALRAHHDVDLELTRRVAAEMSCESIVGFALSLERTLRGLPIDTNHWAQPSWLDRASYVRPTRQLAMERIRNLTRIDNRKGQFTYALSWILPTADEAALRGGLKSYFRRALPARLGGQYHNTDPL